MHQMIYHKTLEKASKASVNMKTDCQYVKRKHTYGTTLMDGNQIWLEWHNWSKKDKNRKREKASEKSEPFYWRCYILIHLLRSNLAERFPPV